MKLVVMCDVLLLGKRQEGR